MSGWIGVDLDGTLAHYDEWRGVTHIGAPVRAMVERVIDWIEEGRDVRIFTARVSHDGSNKRVFEAQQAREAIVQWCKEHLGRELIITHEKDYHMHELWDDRAVRVLRNDGRRCCNRNRGVYDAMVEAECAGIEHITHVAIQKEDKVYRLCWPARHHHVLHMLSQTVGDIGKHEQGFVTSTERFVTREEAAEIARAAGQTTMTRSMLFSEDVW